MTITITPSSGTHLFNGLALNGSLSGFPFLAGDEMVVNVNRDSDGLAIASAFNFRVTPGAWDVTIAIDQIQLTFAYPQAIAPLDAACTVTVAWNRAGGSNVEFEVFSGYLWDPATPEAAMLNWLVQFSNSSLVSSLLAQILAAVKRVY